MLHDTDAECDGGGRAGLFLGRVTFLAAILLLVDCRSPSGLRPGLARIQIVSAHATVLGDAADIHIRFSIDNLGPGVIYRDRCGAELLRETDGTLERQWIAGCLDLPNRFTSIPQGTLVEDTLRIGEVNSSHSPGEWPYSGTGGTYHLRLFLIDQSSSSLALDDRTSSAFQFSKPRTTLSARRRID